MERTPETAPALGPALLGWMLRAAADLPRQPSTDALVAQAVLQADARALESPEFRKGLAACLASARHPGDEKARTQDAAQWEALLSSPHAEPLLGDPRLTPEQRLEHLSFFLLRPEFPLELLPLYEAHLSRIAAHEAQLALQGFPPEQVAPIARFPSALMPRFPELAALAQPVDAQAIAALVPHVLRPDQAALLLEGLADELLSSATEGAPAQEHRSAFARMAAEGPRALAEWLRAEATPQQVAQALVLGGLQHQAFLENLAPFAEHEAAGAAREVLLTSLGHLGMAMGGPVGMAAAGMICRVAFQAVDALCEGGRLPLGAIAGEVLGIPGLGLAPHALGEVTAALAQLYASQITELAEDAVELLGDFGSTLLGGQVEGLGEAWAARLGDAEFMSALQATDAWTRAEILRVLVVGGALGLYPWAAVVPGLQAHGPTLFGHSLPPDIPPQALVELLAASAARAVATLGNDELWAGLSEGSLSPAEALAASQERGAALFEGGLRPADPLLTTALLAALVPPSTP